MADTPTEDEVRAWLGSMRAFGAVLTSHHPRELAASALALLDEARKDRERLDWLAATCVKDRLCFDGGQANRRVAVFVGGARNRTWGTDLRAAIDQARGEG